MSGSAGKFMQAFRKSPTATFLLLLVVTQSIPDTIWDGPYSPGFVLWGWVAAAIQFWGTLWFCGAAVRQKGMPPEVNPADSEAGFQLIAIIAFGIALGTSFQWLLGLRLPYAAMQPWARDVLQGSMALAGFLVAYVGYVIWRLAARRRQSHA